MLWLIDFYQRSCSIISFSTFSWCHFSSILLPPAQRREAMERRKGGQKGGRADRLYPLPARIHLCGRWDPILHPHYCTSSCKTSPFLFANPWSSADIYNNEARILLAFWSLKGIIYSPLFTVLHLLLYISTSNIFLMHFASGKRGQMYNMRII